MTRNIPPHLKVITAGLIISSALLTTHQANAQCIPTFVDGCGYGDQINSFSITGEESSSISDLFTGCSAGSYNDATSGTSSLEMSAGGTYTATISTMYYEPGLGEGDHAAIWIDFNDDGIFGADERVAATSSLISMTGSSINITIPSDAPVGIHTMRVMVGINHNASFDPITGMDLDPCNTGINEVTYGEVHDYTINTTPAPLSVSLIDFKGEINNSIVNLTWKTVSESNNQGFKIMKSQDGKSFTQVGWLPSNAQNGQSNEKLAYHFEEQLNANNGVFYQLIQVDLDGRAVHSHIVHLQQNINKTTVTASPNPAKNNIVVSGPKRIAGEAKIILTDITGSVLQQIAVSSTNTTIDLSNLNSGMYIIQYSDAEVTESIKVSKF